MTSTPPDPWAPLTRLTTARIALGRAGGSLPTRAHLAFQLAHAQARDAVHHAADFHRVAADLEGAGLAVLPLGALPWPTKLHSNVTSLALLLRNK